MLIFVELLFSFYIFVNFLMVSFESDHKNVYQAFDWYYYPGRAIGATIVCYLLLAIIFAVFWFLSQKCKLPKYRRSLTDRFGTITSNQDLIDGDDDDADDETLDQSPQHETSYGLNDDIAYIPNPTGLRNGSGLGSSSKLGSNQFN